MTRPSDDWCAPTSGGSWYHHLQKLMGMYAVTEAKGETAEAVAHKRFFVYPAARELWKQTESTGHCVRLIQDHVADAGPTKGWKPGPRVQDCSAGDVPEGTVIATFWGGVYPNKSTGNHAAFYLGHDADGILVVEQAQGKSPSAMKAARAGGAGKIRWKKITLAELAGQSGEAPHMTNTAEYYYVVLDQRQVG